MNNRDKENNSEQEQNNKNVGLKPNLRALSKKNKNRECTHTHFNINKAT